MTSDNRHFDVNGESLTELEACLKLVLLLEERRGFRAFRVDNELGLILYTQVPQGATPFLVEQDSDLTAKSVFDWLKSQPNDAFAEWGSHDGDNARGWRVHMDFWGGVKGDSNATVAIKPSWLWLGK